MLQPRGARVVVEPDELEQEIGGVIIPNGLNDGTPSHTGRVVAVGPGEPHPRTGELVPVALTVGDRVVYSKYGGTETKLDGATLLLLRDADILALIP